jgi:hypothetical protein
MIPAWAHSASEAELAAWTITELQASPFYGLDGLPARMLKVRAFLGHLRVRAKAWATTTHRNLARPFPGEDLDITVYPIIGYDTGIGLSGAVCLNCN